MNEKYFNDYMKKNEQLNLNLINDKNNLNKDNIGVSNIVEQFFLRQINNNEDNI